MICGVKEIPFFLLFFPWTRLTDLFLQATFAEEDGQMMLRCVLVSAAGAEMICLVKREKASSLTFRSGVYKSERVG